ncbi:purine nucleoside permease [Microbulbifer rhizosphaerae]|uniref:Purine nucleoside permease n=1 Tax=Microbulbifer rhizosphaerae TaxID=1562603 RepID=A0A7W4WEP9_9GAMM|nr:purine nucleoside permease [Microbulbifer rhizosphaerae]MBB3062883.1 purine nucleoside permease [Microbulbifer rhizosphaerae]
MLKKITVALLTLGLLACNAEHKATAPVAKKETPLPVKVVVVTMFEIGEDSGDTAGEFQLWNERRKLDQVLPFHGHHDLHYNPESQILGMVTGIGTAKSAASVMALGMDPRFDLSKAYWLVAGISGFDPADASIGSAAWADYVVDGDLAHEIDPREIPEDWPFGYFARDSKGPMDKRPEPSGEVFALNKSLSDWAYGLTKDMKLQDFPGMEPVRALYTETPAAQREPFVLKGDNLAAMTYWHGDLMNDWANRWVDYWTDGEGQFVSSAMEDTGTYQSLLWLSKTGRADVQRLMVLRTASNYTTPPPGMTAVENLLKDNEGYPGLQASLESAYSVGSVVIDELLANWDSYKDAIPRSIN